MVVANAKIYQSLQASNTNHSPSVEANIGVWWQVVSPTNKMKMFDTSNSTASTATNTMTFTVQPGTVTNSVAFLAMSNINTGRVVMTDPVDGVVFDQTYDFREVIPEANWWSYYFAVTSLITDFTVMDLPSYGSATITVTLTGSGTIGLGTFIMGIQRFIGMGVHYGASLSVQDYSRTEFSEYGDLILQKRNYSQRATFEMTLTAAETDAANRLLTSIRATPVLWVGTEEYETAILFGIFKELSIQFTHPQHNQCSLQLYGLARI